MGVFLFLLLLQREAKKQNHPPPASSWQTQPSASLEHPRNANPKAGGGPGKKAQLRGISPSCGGTEDPEFKPCSCSHPWKVQAETTQFITPVTCGHGGLQTQRSHRAQPTAWLMPHEQQE